jgi:hypothetical protein
LITGWLVATHPEHALNRSAHTRAPGPGEVVACPFGVHFCPAGEGSLVPGLRGCDLLENPQRTNQHADGPGRRISPCSEPGGRIWCIAESGGRSAGPSCLVLTLICPIAEFSFAFAQGPSFAGRVDANHVQNFPVFGATIRESLTMERSQQSQIIHVGL